MNGRHKGEAQSLAECFNPRANSIGFLRWLMALLVIFSHAGPLAGFYGGHDLGTQISTEQSVGGVAVAGFFFFSGYLITNSRRGKSTIFRYFWRRILRIFPAFWLALMVTSLVLAPIAWRKSTGNWDGYWDASNQSPLTYFVNNMLLDLNQRNIANMGGELPYAQIHGAYDWNGAAWTLKYEFICYVLVGVIGLFGLLAYRRIAAILAIGLIVLNAMQWAGAGNLTAVSRVFADPYLLMFLAPFAFGMLFALFPDLIPIDDRLAIGAAILAGGAYAFGGWNIYGMFAFAYFLMWLAVRLPLQNWERYGDFSYGIYIFGWPIMTFAAFFGLQERGWVVYHLVVIVAAHAMALLSWNFIEKPAMSLKNWTPKWWQRVLNRWEPTELRLKHRIVNPAYSSTHFANRMRTESDEANATPVNPKEG